MQDPSTQFARQRIINEANVEMQRHDLACAVQDEHARLRNDIAVAQRSCDADTDGDLAVLYGALIEYGDQGDQVVENCNCGLYDMPECMRPGFRHKGM